MYIYRYVVVPAANVCTLDPYNMNSVGPYNIFHINRSFILTGGLVHSVTVTVTGDGITEVCIV